jgi:protein gp37
MNKQTENGIEWTNFTWNPVGGCQHNCKWFFGSKIVKCYAGETARTLRTDKFYPKGFEHHYWHPDRLNEPLRLKKPARIFSDSMSDLFGHWVPEEQIQAVLDVMEKAHWHTFQVLTKNPVRMKNFVLPGNVWAGISMPPDSFMGEIWTPRRREVWFLHALDFLADMDVPVKWISFEPLSSDVVPDLEAWTEKRGEWPFKWAVIGAGSDGARKYPPVQEHFEKLVAFLNAHGTAIFYKGNLKEAPYITDWRQEWPK